MTKPHEAPLSRRWPMMTIPPPGEALYWKMARRLGEKEARDLMEIIRDEATDQS